MLSLPAPREVHALHVVEAERGGGGRERERVVEAGILKHFEDEVYTLLA
jgi:hypothetical protein